MPVATEQPSSDHAFRGKIFNEGLRIMIILIGTAALISGVVGNVLQLVVMFKRRKLKRFGNVFIANLALADLLVICSAMPNFLLDLMSGKHPVVDQTHCKYVLLISISHFFLRSPPPPPPPPPPPSSIVLPVGRLAVSSFTRFLVSFGCQTVTTRALWTCPITSNATVFAFFLF